MCGGGGGGGGARGVMEGSVGGTRGSQYWGRGFSKLCRGNNGEGQGAEKAEQGGLNIEVSILR